MILPLLVVLAQAPDQAGEPQAAPPAAEEKPSPPVEKKPEAEPKPHLPAPEVQAPTMTPNQITRELERIKKLPPEEQGAAATQLGARMPKVTPEDVKRFAPSQLPTNPMMPEVKNYAELPETEQVKYSAREFFTQLIAGDARNITSNCAFPFQLEERRLQTPDELFGEWLKNLRAKRTDLLTLYDIEVLSPADMEKKYGKPPARLQNLPWKAAKTYVAVANLSGHAAVAVFRNTGAAWAVVGYAD
jgi:hypothetical protein